MDRTADFNLVRFAKIIQILLNWFNTTRDPITVTAVLAQLEGELGRKLYKRERVYVRQIASRKLDYLVQSGLLRARSNKSPQPKDYTLTDSAMELILTTQPADCVATLVSRYGGHELDAGTPKKKFASKSGKKEAIKEIAAAEALATYELPGGGTITAPATAMPALLEKLNLIGNGATTAVTAKGWAAEPPVIDLKRTICELVGDLAAQLRATITNMRASNGGKDALSIRNLSLGLSQLDKIFEGVKHNLSGVYVDKTGMRSCNMPNSSTVALPDSELDALISYLADVELAAAEGAHQKGPLVLPLLRPATDADPKTRTPFACSFKSADDVRWKYVGRAKKRPADKAGAAETAG